MFLPTSPSHALALGLLGLAAYWAGWIVYCRTLHPLRGIPGPWLASVSRLWYMAQIYRGDMEQTQRRLHARHGPVLRIAPNEVACAAPEAIRTVYRTTGALDKTDFYHVWNTVSGDRHRDNFTETSDRKHATRRRIVNHLYSLTNVLRSERYIDECSAVFMRQLDVFAAEGKPLDLGKWLQMYAFDVVGELYFGRQFGFLARGADHGHWIASLDLLMPLLCTVAVAPAWARPLILASGLVIPGATKTLSAVDKMSKAACEAVARRLDVDESKAERRTDFLEQMYAIYQEKGAKVDFNMPEIEQEAHVALFAGSDTTAIGLRSVLYHVTRDARIHATLTRELDAAFAAGRLGSPASFADASRLPYLCACVKEGLRVHPGVQLSMGRVSPTGGLHLPCGPAEDSLHQTTFIPAGYWVGLNPAVVHRDRAVFGPDADVFRPERWLPGVDEGEDAARARVADMDRHMLHFGAGTRTCIGKNISLVEMHKLVPDLLRRFDFAMWHPDAEWTTRNLWFCKQEGIVVRVKRRQ